MVGPSVNRPTPLKKEYRNMDYQRIKTNIIMRFQSLYGLHDYGKNRPFAGACHHHIVHKHEGGTDNPSNLVWLSRKAHCLIHTLDSRLDPRSRFKRHSALMMNGLTEQAAIEQLEAARAKGRDNFLASARFAGKTQSEYQRKKASEVHTGKVVSAETRAKQSAARKGRPPWNKGISIKTKIRGAV